MGKRSDFARIPRDKYRTQPSCIPPLLPFLAPSTLFIEPCAGDGSLVALLEDEDHICVAAFDIEPEPPVVPIGVPIEQRDALAPLDFMEVADCFITNPPWDRKVLHPMIVNLSDLMPTWLLFDADWIHTVQASELALRCRRVVSVGRVKWMPGTKHTGMDNCAWYEFGQPSRAGTRFHFRQGRSRP